MKPGNRQFNELYGAKSLQDDSVLEDEIDFEFDLFFWKGIFFNLRKEKQLEQEGAK